MKYCTFGAAVALLSVAALSACLQEAVLDSGPAIGKYVTPMHPLHMAGPDKGTDTCPP